MVAARGSLPGLYGAIDYVKADPDKIRFLPVFYHLLDPLNIPSERVMDTQLEVLPEETFSTITRAFLSLEGTFYLPFSPSGSHPELWQRFWPRIPGAPSEDDLHARFFSVINHLMETNTKTSGQIISTPGIGVSVTQAWASYFRDPNFTTEAAIRSLASFFITTTAFIDQFNFNEFADGAGARPKEDAWTSVLRSNKYLRTLISVMQFAARGLPLDTMNLCEDLCIHAWNAFVPILLNSSGYSHIVEIIDAGFLTFVVSLANKQNGKPTMGFVTVATDRLEIKKRFDSGEYVARKACDNMEVTWFQNLLYGKISNRTDFKCCAGCEYQYYCSKECQIRDWRTGHRKNSQHTRPPGKSYLNTQTVRVSSSPIQTSDGWYADYLDGPAYFTGRDRFFVRAIVARNYERHKEQIFLTRIVRMRHHGIRVYTLFDYSQSEVRIDVKYFPVWGDVTFSNGQSEAVFECTLILSKSPKTFGVRPFGCFLRDPAMGMPIMHISTDVTDVSGLPPYLLQRVRQLIKTVCPGILEIV
ncbi:hypothetical protein B0H19DRAFT_1316342 [Mycena capillaripes]|nr:hypothetical protein B0H19DRAFT_1316342 [Mycena capillaripes]